MSEEIPQRRVEVRREADSDEQLDVRGPGGLSLSLRGKSQTVLMVVMAVVLVAGLFYKLFEHSAETTLANQTTTASIVKLEKTTRAMIYVLALTPDQREKLQLQKPDEIKQMEREAR